MNSLFWKALQLVLGLYLVAALAAAAAQLLVANLWILVLAGLAGLGVRVWWRRGARW